MDRKFNVLIHKYLTDFAKYTAIIYTYIISRQMPRLGMLWGISNEKPILSMTVGSAATYNLRQKTQ